MYTIKDNDFSEEKIEAIYKLFNKYSKQVGFVMKPAIRESVRNNELHYIEINNKIVACNKFHDRRDGVTIIYEIVVDEDQRGKGLGKLLIEHLIKNRYRLLLKCPVDNISNGFYQKVGFKKIGTVKGKKRDLNIWTIKGNI